MCRENDWELHASSIGTEADIQKDAPENNPQ